MCCTKWRVNTTCCFVTFTTFPSDFSRRSSEVLRAKKVNHLWTSLRHNGASSIRWLREQTFQPLINQRKHFTLSINIDEDNLQVGMGYYCNTINYWFKIRILKIVSLVGSVNFRRFSQCLRKHIFWSYWKNVGWFNNSGNWWRVHSTMKFLGLF